MREESKIQNMCSNVQHFRLLIKCKGASTHWNDCFMSEETFHQPLLAEISIQIYLRIQELFSI